MPPARRKKQRPREPFLSCVVEIWDGEYKSTRPCLHDCQPSRHAAGRCLRLQHHWCHSCFRLCRLEALQFWHHCQIILERTTSAFDAVVVHPRGREKHQDVVTRARSSMERCRQDFRVVRRRRKLCMEKEGLRTSKCCNNMGWKVVG